VWSVACLPYQLLTAFWSWADASSPSALGAVAYAMCRFSPRPAALLCVSPLHLSGAHPRTLEIRVDAAAPSSVRRTCAAAELDGRPAFHSLLQEQACTGRCNSGGYVIARCSYVHQEQLADRQGPQRVSLGGIRLRRGRDAVAPCQVVGADVQLAFAVVAVCRRPRKCARGRGQRRLCGRRRLGRCYCRRGRRRLGRCYCRRGCRRLRWSLCRRGHWRGRRCLCGRGRHHLWRRGCLRL